MIPAYTLSGYLPPFIGSNSTVNGARSPYPTTTSEIAETLCTSPQRENLFRGFLTLRARLTGLGIQTGVQWINGSFCEDVESTRGRSPGDIDVVTLFERPPHWADSAAVVAAMQSSPDVFVHTRSKAVYGCDAYFIDGGRPVLAVVQQVNYWVGLFEHDRKVNLWKGILQVDLGTDDSMAWTILGPGKFIP